MAIGYHTTKGSRRIRFTSNVGYEGVDFGPDYDEQDVELPANEAFRFVREGRARYIDDGTDEPVIDQTQSGKPETAKAKGGHK